MPMFTMFIPLETARLLF